MAEAGRHRLRLRQCEGVAHAQVIWVSIVGALRGPGGEGLGGGWWWPEAFGDWRDAPWAAEGWHVDAWSCPVNNGGGGGGCVLEGWELRGWGGAASAWGGRVEVRRAVACAV
jgi:hypothetical protein